MFKSYDYNNDGQLSPTEIYSALKKANKDVSYGLIYRIMREFDTDGDKELN